MENTLHITTFNSLNNPDRKEERVEALFKEITEHNSDIVLLQEVMDVTFPLLKERAEKDGWHLSEGPRVAFNPTKVSGNVTLSRKPIISEFILPSPIPEDLPHVKTLITHLEGGITVINAHLPWGSTTENYRLDTAYRINQYAEELRDLEPETLIVMGGDLNATPSSSVLRYLTGDFPYKNTSTVWTNAWNFSDDVFPTARKDGGWAEATAKGVGILRPDLMPDRTIDHILTFGWNFGKKHSPLQLRKFGETELSNGYGLSDHYGLTVEIMV